MDVEKWTDNELKRLEKKVREVYKEAYNDMNQKLDRYLNGFNEDGVHHAGMYERIEKEKLAYKKGVYNDKEWESYLEAQLRRANHFQTLRDEYANRLVNAELEAQKIVNGRLPKIYAENSNDIIRQLNEELEKMKLNRVGTQANPNVNPNNVSFELIDEEAVKRWVAGAKDGEIYRHMQLDIVKSNKWNNTKIQNQLLQGIVQGESYKQMQERLIRVVGMDEASAIRTVRTCVTGVRSKAKQDRYEALAKKGCIATKIWIDVHDSVPPEREAHWNASGQEVDYNEPFEVGGEELMYPCDTSRGASGWNIYNCRCRMGKGSFRFYSQLPEELQGSIVVKEV